ncbi:hypothetical protein GEMRC1_005493 [Eukaryota sp. GEM-RC1]
MRLLTPRKFVKIELNDRLIMPIYDHCSYQKKKAIGLLRSKVKELHKQLTVFENDSYHVFEKSGGGFHLKAKDLRAQWWRVRMNSLKEQIPQLLHMPINLNILHLDESDYDDFLASNLKPKKISLNHDDDFTKLKHVKMDVLFYQPIGDDYDVFYEKIVKMNLKSLEFEYTFYEGAFTLPCVENLKIRLGDMHPEQPMMGVHNLTVIYGNQQAQIRYETALWLTIKNYEKWSNDSYDDEGKIDECIITKIE